MIEAGVSEKKPKNLAAKDSFEIVDKEENFDNDMAFLQDKMRLMLHRSQQIQLNEKAQIIQMMHDSKMRMVMTEIL
jgi:hypothetical protein